MSVVHPVSVVEEANFDWSGNSLAMLKANWIFLSRNSVITSYQTTIAF